MLCAATQWRHTECVLDGQLQRVSNQGCRHRWSEVTWHPVMFVLRERSLSWGTSTCSPYSILLVLSYCLDDDGFLGLRVIIILHSIPLHSIASFSIHHLTSPHHYCKIINQLNIFINRSKASLRRKVSGLRQLIQWRWETMLRLLPLHAPCSLVRADI